MWRWCRRNPALAAASGLAAGSVVAAVVVLVTLAVVQTNAANTERGLRGELGKTLTAVEKERDIASAQRIKAQGLAADMALERGTALATARDSAGLLWMARALEISPPERSETNGRIIRANFASWSEDAPVRRAFMTQNGQITSAKFSPDGRMMLTSDFLGTARLWNANDFSPIGSPMTHFDRRKTNNEIMAIAFSPDGAWSEQRAPMAQPSSGPAPMARRPASR